MNDGRTAQPFHPACAQHGLALPLAALAALTMLMSPASTRAAEAQVEQQDNGAVHVEAARYTARIRPDGNLRLSVDGAPAVRAGFSRQVREKRPTELAPLTDAPDITVDGRHVKVRDGDRRIEYTFHPERIEVTSAGYGLTYGYGEAAIAGAHPDGGGGPVGRRQQVGRIRTVLLNNGRTVRFSRDFHMTDRRRGFLVPSAYIGGANLERGEQLSFTIFPGEQAEPRQYVSEIEIAAVSSSRSSVRAGGNRGNIEHFPDASDIRLATAQRNIADEPFGDVTHRLHIVDHYFEGETVFDEPEQVTLSAEARVRPEWQLPELKPGFYYATAEARRDGETLSSTELIFAVDLPNYSHELTRPDDFEAFWRKQLKQLRSVPFNAQLDEVPSESSKQAVHYELTIDGPDGEPLDLLMEVPRGDGPFVEVRT